MYRDSPTRADVRRRLLKAGWRELPSGSLTKGPAVFTSLGKRRESVLKLAEANPDFSVDFSPLIPAKVIVAACEAAA